MPTEEGQDEASRKALEYSAFYRGKIGTVPKVPVKSLDDFSVWYTPGVAAVSRRRSRRTRASGSTTPTGGTRLPS